MSGGAQVLLFARQELLLAARSRFTQIFAALFALLALGVASAGYVLSGGSGVQDFARTAASLVQLVLLLASVAALVLGVLSLAPERGAAELLYAQPVARRTVLLGKLLGLLTALSSAEALGFGAAGLVIFSRVGGDGLGDFALLLLAAIATTAVFLAIAALLSAGAVGKKKTRALALALVVWFFAVVLFDVGALALASLLPSGPASRVLITAVLVNPADAVRTGALLAVQGTSAFGAGSLALLRFTRGPLGAGLLVGASVLLWIAVPVSIAAWRLRRVDL